MSSDFVCMGRECLAILFVWVDSVEGYYLYRYTVDSDYVCIGTQGLAILLV